jgi:hypothetical protein
LFGTELNVLTELVESTAGETGELHLNIAAGEQNSCTTESNVLAEFVEPIAGYSRWNISDCDSSKNVKAHGTNVH